MINKPVPYRTTRISYEIEFAKDFDEKEYEKIEQFIPSGHLKLEGYKIYRYDEDYVDSPDILIVLKDVDTVCVKVDNTLIGITGHNDSYDKFLEIVESAVDKVLEDRDFEYESNLYWITTERTVAECIDTVNGNYGRDSTDYDINKVWGKTYDGMGVYRLLEDGRWSSKNDILLVSNSNRELIYNYHEQHQKSVIQNK